MGRNSNEIKTLKLKAIAEAIKILKDESTPTSNHVTFPKVINTANELYIDKLPTKISPTSLKSPTSNEFKKLKKEIDDYRSEHKKGKTLIPKKSLKEVTKLKKQIANLMFEVSKYYDEKLLFNEELVQKEKTIKKLKEERDEYYQKIKILEK